MTSEGGPYSDVDPLTAPVGSTFVIQQHHATALHHDVRLEMLNPGGPVLVSWAVPKGLPRHRGERHLAIRTPDHSMEHATFSGSIPEDEYGGGEVRIFDHGRYEMVARTEDRLTFRLDGRRLAGVWHLVRTDFDENREQWLAMMREDLRPPGDPRPRLDPMTAVAGGEPFDDPDWGFEPRWEGTRAFALCGEETALVAAGGEVVSEAFPDLGSINQQVVALDAVLDGVVVDGTYVVFDLVWIDGKDLTGEPLAGRRRTLSEVVVPSARIQLSPLTEAEGVALAGAVSDQGIEGMVAKRLASHYQPGVASPDWLELRI